VVFALLSGLLTYIRCARPKALCLLGTTAVVALICKCLGMSNILGFLTMGIALLSNKIGGGIVSDVHWMDMLANLGIVFFLFEMGLHINFGMLVGMRRDIFPESFSKLEAVHALQVPSPRHAKNCCKIGV
jgi:Kef-type K+ transport system membrane component KefB